MLDIVVKIAGLLKDALSLFQGQGDKKRRRVFGKAAMTCYLRLLEVIASAESVHHELEFFQRRFKEHIDCGDDWEYGRWGILATLKKQSLNLMRLGWALKSIKEELAILAPNIAAELNVLIKHKKNVIATLSDYCVSGNLPLHITVGERDRRWGSPKITADLLDTQPKWDLEVYQRVEEYLADAAPAERIQMLKKAADSMRDLLAKSFSLDELLWTAEQFRDTTDYLF